MGRLQLICACPLVAGLGLAAVVGAQGRKVPVGHHHLVRRFGPYRFFTSRVKSSSRRLQNKIIDTTIAFSVEATNLSYTVASVKKESHMMKIGSALLGLSVCVAIALANGSATPDSKYRVFCANEKIEVEQRTLEQQKNARGSNVCVLAEYDYLSDADKDAEKRGGKGADCKCP